MRILVPGASWFSELQRDDLITGIGKPTWCAKARLAAKTTDKPNVRPTYIQIRP